MEKIALITDSSCDLPQSMVEKYNINVLPLHVIFRIKSIEMVWILTPRNYMKNYPWKYPKLRCPQ